MPWWLKPASAEPYEYAPDHCDFTVTFPEEPQIRTLCENGKENCYDEVSFTMAYEVNSSVKANVICNSANPALFAQYNERAMRTTVRALAKRNDIDEYNISFRETDNYRQAGAAGQGISGGKDTLFVGQLWVSEKSIMSLEAKLIGQPFEAADQLFSDILKSTKFKAESKPEKPDRD